MPNFQATTAEELRKVGQPKDAPPPGVPECNTDFLANTLDGIAVQFYVYPAPKSHTIHDLIRPNYFRRCREHLAQQLKAGARCFIFCILGEREDGSTTMWLEVIEAKIDPAHPVIVAKGDVRHFTPCRHDGTLDDDDGSEKSSTKSGKKVN